MKAWPHLLRHWPEIALNKRFRTTRHPRTVSTMTAASFGVAVLAIGGPDLGKGWPSTYQDEDGARDIILSFGRDLELAIAHVCEGAGLDEVSPPLARRGDVTVTIRSYGPITVRVRSRNDVQLSAWAQAAI